MAGLGFPRDYFLEAYLGDWVDVTAQLRQTSPVTATYGQGDEQAMAAPNKLQFTMHNNEGDWAPENPLGDHYGQLAENTPVRFGFEVTTGTASHSLSAAGTQITTFGDPVLDGAFSYQYTPSVSNITGGEIGTSAVLRYVDASNFYFVRAVIDPTTDRYYLQAWRISGGVPLNLHTSVDTGISHTSGTPVRVAAMMEGKAIFGKLWPASQPEPYDWALTAVDQDEAGAITTPGQFGIRSEAVSGNSNTKPIGFTYTGAVGRIVIMHSEISEFNEEWDEAHANMTTGIRAEGVLRRLRSGDAPLQSTLRRRIELNPTGLQAYWSCEDGKYATQVSAAGGYTESMFPTSVTGGAIKFASNTEFICSQPILQLGKADLTGNLRTYTPTGTVSVMFLMSIPASGAVDAQVICRIYTTATTVNGAIYFWDLVYFTGFGGQVALRGYDGFGNLVVDSGTWVFLFGGVDGHPCRFQIELKQNGANVDWSFAAAPIPWPSTYSFSYVTGTASNVSIGAADRIVMNPYQTLDNVAVGHIAVWSVSRNMALLRDEVEAYRNEPSGIRAIRLCIEQGVPCAWEGDPNTTGRMGAQLTNSFVDLLDEAMAMNGGLWHDMRSHAGLYFRFYDTLPSRAPRVTLDYSAGQISAPLRPAKDNANTVNSFLARQVNGSEYLAEKTSGPKNINNPWDDPEGVGKYESSKDFSVYAASQLTPIADWEVLKGATPVRRFREIPLNLRSETLQPAALAALMAVAMGDRVVIENLQQAWQFEDIDQMVLGWTMTLADKTQHRLVLNGVPYDPWKAFTVGKAGYDRADSRDTVLNEDLDTTETGIDILNGSVNRWVTTALHPTAFPFDVMIGGERITITAGSGTGSVQTLTGTRSVNGVVKTHLTGTPVVLADPVYLGRQ